MSAYVGTRVEFTIEAGAGPFGEDWKLDAVRKDGKRSAEDAVLRLQEAAAKIGIRLINIKISDGCYVKFDGDETR